MSVDTLYFGINIRSWMNELIFDILQVDSHDIHVIDTNQNTNISLDHVHVKTQQLSADQYIDSCHSHRIILANAES